LETRPETKPSEPESNESSLSGVAAGVGDAMKTIARPFSAKPSELKGTEGGSNVKPGFEGVSVKLPPGRKSRL
jgi:hypothetical protein